MSSHSMKTLEAMCDPSIPWKCTNTFSKPSSSNPGHPKGRVFAKLPIKGNLENPSIQNSLMMHRPPLPPFPFIQSGLVCLWLRLSDQLLVHYCLPCLWQVVSPQVLSDRRPWLYILYWIGWHHKSLLNSFEPRYIDSSSTEFPCHRTCCLLTKIHCASPIPMLSDSAVAH